MNACCDVLQKKEKRKREKNLVPFFFVEEVVPICLRKLHSFTCDLK